MSKDDVRKYNLLCVKCPFCKEIVEAEVTEINNSKTIYCPACKAKAEYKINN